MVGTCRKEKYNKNGKKKEIITGWAGNIKIFGFCLVKWLIN